MSFEIQTTSYFDSEAKRLAKRHRSFVDDLSDFRDSILKNPYQGTELSPGIRKVRMTIASKGRGQSGGARIITFTYLVNEKGGVVILLLLYDKADASNIKISVVRQIIKELGLDLQTLQSEGKLKAVEIEEEKTPIEQETDSLQAVKAFCEFREQVESGHIQLPDLTVDEINEEIKLVREGRAAREMGGRQDG